MTFKPLGGYHLGIHAGNGTVSITGLDAGNDTENGPGYTISGFLTYWMDENLALEVELQYSQQTGVQTIYDYQFDSSIRGGGYSYYDEMEWTLKYLEIPILFRWATSEKARNPDGSPVAGVFEPFFEFGTGFSFLLDTDRIEDLRLPSNAEGLSPDINYVNWGLTSYSVQTGMGVNLKVPSGFITLQSRFRAGFASHGHNAEDAYTMVIWLMAGYGWSFH